MKILSNIIVQLSRNHGYKYFTCCFLLDSDGLGVRNYCGKKGGISGGHRASICRFGEVEYVICLRLIGNIEESSDLDASTSSAVVWGV